MRGFRRQLLSNPDVRLEPVNTVTRVAEDHIGVFGRFDGRCAASTGPAGPSSIIPESPSNITVLILHGRGNPGRSACCRAAGLTTGVVTRTVGPYPGKVQDLATRERRQYLHLHDAR